MLTSRSFIALAQQALEFGSNKIALIMSSCTWMQKCKGQHAKINIKNKKRLGSSFKSFNLKNVMLL